MSSSTAFVHFFIISTLFVSIVVIPFVAVFSIRTISLSCYFLICCCFIHRQSNILLNRRNSVVNRSSDRNR
ncbi:hypothetical protein Hanom_Chr05g00397071 [Helianthus anomalus]